MLHWLISRPSAVFFIFLSLCPGNVLLTRALLVVFDLFAILEQDAPKNKKSKTNMILWKDFNEEIKKTVLVGA